MQLNQIELIAMNNPVRRVLQKQIEFRNFTYLLKKHQIDLSNKKILDLACGSGYSLKLLNAAFKPSFLVGFDIMSSQISKAATENSKAHLFRGDLLKLAIKDNSFDAVFGFGILHHVLDWQLALKEISRITKINGYLIMEEPNGSASEFFRKYCFFQIPKEGQFTFQELLEFASQEGFELIESRKIIQNSFKSFLLQKK